MLREFNLHSARDCTLATLRSVPQRLRPVLVAAVRLLDTFIADKVAAGNDVSGLLGLSSRATRDLRDWADVDTRTRGKDGGNEERERFVLFHPRLAVMCLTAAVINGEAAVAAGSVRLRCPLVRSCFLNETLLSARAAGPVSRHS